MAISIQSRIEAIYPIVHAQMNQIFFIKSFLWKKWNKVIIIVIVKQFVTRTKSMNKNIELEARAVTRWPNNNHSLKAVLK